MPTEILCDAKYLRLIRRENWEFVQRKNVTGIVGIIAITNDKKLILVEQYRPPVGKNVIEIPAGLAGDSPASRNEDLALAAARELEEETGYRAVRMVELATGTASAGLCDEIITLFRRRQRRHHRPRNRGGSDRKLAENPTRSKQTRRSQGLLRPALHPLIWNRIKHEAPKTRSSPRATRFKRSTRQSRR